MTHFVVGAVDTAALEADPGLWVPKMWSCALTRHDALASWGPMCRILYRLLVSLARLAVCSGRSKDLEIIVLRLWVPIIRSWALTRGFALHPGTRNRYEIRYTRTQHRPASRQVNDRGRVSGTHRSRRAHVDNVVEYLECCE